MAIVGIDLGTSNSAATVLRGGRPVIIPSAEGTTTAFKRKMSRREQIRLRNRDFRIAAHGIPSPQPGGMPGDLFVVVHSAPDPRFERSGANLWHTKDISLTDAVLGTSLRVPTLDGSATARVPAGRQPDTVLRLRGKGLPEFGGKAQGDLYIRLPINIPERLTPAERDLYERLKALEPKR